MPIIPRQNQILVSILHRQGGMQHSTRKDRASHFDGHWSLKDELIRSMGKGLSSQTCTHRTDLVEGVQYAAKNMSPIRQRVKREQVGSTVHRTYQIFILYMVLEKEGRPTVRIWRKSWTLLRSWPRNKRVQDDDFSASRREYFAIPFFSAIRQPTDLFLFFPIV